MKKVLIVIASLYVGRFVLSKSVEFAYGYSEGIYKPVTIKKLKQLFS